MVLAISIFSFSDTVGTPHGWGILIPLTIRLTPTCLAIGVIAVIITAGIPALSISFVSAEPARVQVPHVLVKTTAETPSLASLSAISLPNF